MSRPAIYPMNDRAILLKMLAVLTEIRDLLTPTPAPRQILRDDYNPVIRPTAVWSGTLGPPFHVGPSHPCDAHLDPESEEERAKRRSYEELASDIRRHSPPPIVLGDPPRTFNPCTHPDMRALVDGICCPECGWTLREEDLRIGHGG